MAVYTEEEEKFHQTIADVGMVIASLAVIANSVTLLVLAVRTPQQLR